MPVVSIYTTDPQIWSRLAGMLAALGESAPDPIHTEAFSDFAAFLDSGKRNPRRILMLAQEGAGSVELAAAAVEECPENPLIWLSDLDFALYSYRLEVTHFALLPGTEEMLRSALRSCEKKRARLPTELPLPLPAPRRSLWQRLIRRICLKD